MSGLDFGLQVKKNGVWQTELDLTETTEKLRAYLGKGCEHYDVILGDKSFCVAIWKKQYVAVYENGQFVYRLSHLHKEGYETPYECQRATKVISGRTFYFKRLVEGLPTYSVTFWIGGDRYTCDYGYGWYKGEWLFNHEPKKTKEVVESDVVKPTVIEYKYKIMYYAGTNQPFRIVDTYKTDNLNEARSWCKNVVSKNTVPWSNPCEYAQLEVWDGINKLSEERFEQQKGA